ncbi:unnamed protein product [Hermetia illucens]|uniref:Uncharacterized protein n=1 Tax=Hermetia illucens TaxID=343691 RepID=A0A7R8V7S3_HERIL|nr:unnamed protein product [Hermetia illucens]
MRTSVGRNNREPIVIDSGGAPAAIEDSTRANEECEMDSVGPSPSPNPEVNDEGPCLHRIRVQVLCLKNTLGHKRVTETELHCI